MSDTTLKDLLREEHRRRKDRTERSDKGERGEKERDRGDKERDRGDKERDRGERGDRERDRGDKERERDRGEKSQKSDRTDKKSAPKYYTDREKEEKEARRRQREHYERERERERQKQREEKRESILPVKEVVQEVVKVVEVSTVEKFIFIFEDDEGVLYTDISKINLNEGDTVKIFPVYLSGHNSNLTEEVVTFTDGRLVPVEENKETTWLNIIQSRDPAIEILLFELDRVVLYNNRFFHCQDDLAEYILNNGCDYISIV